MRIENVIMKKKVLCVICAVFVLAAAFPVIAGASVLAITVEHDEVGLFHDGMAWIRLGDKYGYIDESGELVIPMIFDWYDINFENTGIGWSSYIENLAAFSEGLAAVRIDGKAGFINKTGELAIPAIYDGDFYWGEWGSYIPRFNDGLARIRKDGKSGISTETAGLRFRLNMRERERVIRVSSPRG
jgi:hypothetical protein